MISLLYELALSAFFWIMIPLALLTAVFGRRRR